MNRMYLVTDYTWRAKVVNRGCGSNHSLSTFSSGQGKSFIEMMSHFIKHNLCRYWNAVSNRSLNVIEKIATSWIIRSTRQYVSLSCVTNRLLRKSNETPQKSHPKLLFHECMSNVPITCLTLHLNKTSINSTEYH